MSFRTPVWVIGTILLSLPAFAAEGRGFGLGFRALRQQQQQQNAVDNASVDGTIDKVQKGQILVTTGGADATAGPKPAKPKPGQAPAGQQWVVATYPGSKIMVTGTANLDYLRTGQIIQFKAQYDGHAIQDKVSELTLVSYSPDRPLGMYPGGFTLDNVLPGAAPAAGPVKHVPKPNNTKDAKAGDAKDSTPGMYEIIGRITSVKDNKLTVLAKKGEKALTVELTEFPKIAVAMSDVSLAKVGDRITAKGKKRKIQTGACLADEVTITLSEPLSGKKKAAAAKSDTAKSGHDSAEKEKTAEK